MHPLHRLLCLLTLVPIGLSAASPEPSPLWEKENLFAWCIVPFDAKHRSPAERAEMVVRLGLKRVAYDWRENDVPHFEEEILEYKKHGIEFFAFWDAHENAFALFEKYGLHPQIWVTAPSPNAPTQEERVMQAAEQLRPIVERTRKLGCRLGLYNHGGWGGEPENLVAVAGALRRSGDAAHVGIIYNFHHGHGHIADFSESWKMMQPFVLAVNLNGMEIGGDAKGRKILHLGEGDEESGMMRVIGQSGWRGPVGIIDHRPETDSEETLGNNLRGLEWLKSELGEPGSGGAKPFAAPAAPTP